MDIPHLLFRKTEKNLWTWKISLTRKYLFLTQAEVVQPMKTLDPAWLSLPKTTFGTVKCALVESKDTQEGQQMAGNVLEFFFKQPV